MSRPPSLRGISSTTHLRGHSKMNGGSASADNPHSVPAHHPRFRALALLGRWLAEQAEYLVIAGVQKPAQQRKSSLLLRQGLSVLVEAYSETDFSTGICSRSQRLHRSR